MTRTEYVFTLASYFGPAHEHARKEAQALGIRSFDEANAWIASPVAAPLEAREEKGADGSPLGPGEDEYLSWIRLLARDWWNRAYGVPGGAK